MKLKPVHKSKNIDFYIADTSTSLEIPFNENISAGFPSPAQDFLDVSIDLNQEFVKNPSSTFFGRVNGDSMTGLGIDDGDLVIIDKSIEPRDNMIAVCFIDGEYTMKRIKIEEEICWLIPANDNYRAIKVTPENNFIVWGIVKHVIKSF